MKTVFKVGDKVFDIRLGWGVVEAVDLTGDYSINVGFNDTDYRYTKKGFAARFHEIPMLSFTEYTLENFSQERPCEFEEGEMIAVRDRGSTEWRVREFLEYKDKRFYCKHPDLSHNVGWKQAKKLTDFNK